MPLLQEATERQPLFARAASAARRRFKRAWRSLTIGDRQPAVEMTLAWLVRQVEDAGLPPTPGEAACPGITGEAIVELCELGQFELAMRLAGGLLAMQRDDGALVGAREGSPSIYRTALGLRGLAAVATPSPAAATAATQAAAWLLERIDGAGRLNLDESAALDQRWPQVTVVVALAALQRAARDGLVEKRPWRKVATLIARCREGTSPRWEAPSHVVAPALNALLDLGERDRVRPSLPMAGALRHGNGRITALADEDFVSLSAVAHWAAASFRLGERWLGNQLVEMLRRQQRSTGAFPERYGKAGKLPNRESSAAAIGFLTAARLQVQAAFDANAELPDSIPLDDGRMEAVRQWFADLAYGARVADVGCGPGRFLTRLGETYPAARLTGIDASPYLLSRLPRGVERRAGTMLRLPARDGEFDAAFAVESLEHALLPQQAVAELCRVVRPGGRVLVIDKHRAKQELSLHEPWERWFTPDEVSGWLARQCDEVTVREVPHGRHTRPTGLFLCWTAIRRGV